MNKNLLSKANVVGYGKGLENGALVTTVFVTRKLPLQDLRPQDIVPQEIEGRPTQVIETGEFIAFGTNTAKVRPLMPGYSIGHKYVTAGTLGAVVVSKESEQLLLSNNHVLANCGRAVIGDEILQPGVADGGTECIATLYDYEDLCVQNINCPIAATFEKAVNYVTSSIGSSYRIKTYDELPEPNRVDAAIAIPNDGIEVNSSIKDIGTPTTPREPVLGQIVHKTGRTTGYTTGRVTQTDAMVRVRYPGGFALFEDQVMISSDNGSFSAPGDSGSLVLCGLQPVALLFGGSDKITVANPISFVLDALAVKFP